MLQHLCNTCTSLLVHNNITGKVLCGKMLHYKFHVSEAEEKMQWLKHAGDNAISLWAVAYVGRLDFNSIHVGWNCKV